MGRETPDQIRARLRQKLEKKRAANAGALPPPNFGPPPTPPGGVLPPPTFGPPPLPPLGPKQREEPPKWGGGPSTDGYATAVSDVRRLLGDYEDDPNQGTLCRKCDDWVKDRYDPVKFRNFMSELDTSRGEAN
jgi:hypothetical protein